MNQENNQSPNQEVNNVEQPVVANNQILTPEAVSPATAETTAQPVQTEPTPEVPQNSQPANNNNPKIKEQVIYQMKEDKGGHPLGVLLFFVVILAAIFFLPEITDYIGKFLPGLVSTSTLKNNNNEVTEENPKEEAKEAHKEEAKLFDLNGSISNATIGELQLGNFVKDNLSGDKSLKFYVLNNSDNTFSFNDSTKFYIDLYKNDTYLSSVLVYSYEDIGSKQSKDFSVTISNDSYNKANKFKITRKSKSDYPSVNLKKSQEDYKILTCTYNNNTIDYYFIGSYLEKIEDTISENTSNVNYAADLMKYKDEANRFSTIDAIDYNVIEASNEFAIKIQIDLSKINDVELYNLAIYKYFNYHKESTVVSYEMKALGYTCS